MNFRQLEVFFAMMTSGTVTEAARLLGVSQPAVTTSIQQTEKKLGITLFQREGGRLTPTAEARILFEEAERAHEALDAFMALADRLKVEQGGHVRIAAVPSISLELLPDAIALFQRRQTGFNFSVSSLNTEEILQQLDGRIGTFHLGFTFGQLDDTEFTCQHIGKAELFAVLPSAWKFPGAGPIAPEELKDMPCISGFDSTPSGQACRNLYTSANVEPRIVARIHTHHLAGRLVQRGLGYAILDSVTVRALLHGHLADAVEIRRIEGDPSLPVTAIFGGRRGHGDPARLFVASFEKAYQELSATVEKRLP
jgi:DNA-binding transcriptional LysR family regulator